MFKKPNKSHKIDDRFEFLKGLLTLYKSGKSKYDEKQEILAHISNFAYDPYNRSHFMRLNIINEYFDFLNKPSIDLVSSEFIWAGLCNFSVDPSFQSQINDHFVELIEYLAKTDNPRILSHITTILYYLELPDKSLEKLIKFKEKMKILVNNVIYSLFIEIIDKRTINTQI